MKELPLAGVRVVDLCMFWAGPFATEVLAMLGAEVIKVESIQRIDGLRVTGVQAPTTPDWFEWSALFNTCNHNKLGITLNLGSDRGREMLEELVRRSHIITENFSARVMQNLGLTYDRLRRINPGLIMLSMPGYGHGGPYEHYVSFGPSYEQYGGIAHVSGYRDGPPMIQSGMTDPMGGLTATNAVIIALEHWRRTGEGQYIDMSQVEAATCLAPEPILEYVVTGRLRERMGNQHPSYAPHGVYPCAGEGQWVTIAVTDDDEWRSLCLLAGREDWLSDARFADAALRWTHRDELDELIGEWTCGREKTELARALQTAGVAAMPVLPIAETLQDEHLRARGILQRVERKPNGTHEYPLFPVLFDGCRPSIRWPTPRLGEHNRQVLQGMLGLGDEEMDRLAAERVIGDRPLGV